MHFCLTIIDFSIPYKRIFLFPPNLPLYSPQIIVKRTKPAPICIRSLTLFWTDTAIPKTHFLNSTFVCGFNFYLKGQQ